MISLKSNKKYTLLGYHDKDANQYGLIENEFPILADERYSPFIITSTDNYLVSTTDIINLLKNRQKIKQFHALKLNIASLLILPGLIISLLFIVRSFGLFNNIPTLLSVTSSKILSLTFWISMLGGIILWHDYYRNKSHPVRFPLVKPIEDNELELIKMNGIKFGKYRPNKMIYYLEEHSQNMLAQFYTPEGLDCYSLFEFLVSIDQIQEVIKRAGATLTGADFEKYKISPESMPKYPVPSIRSLVTYALEEALLSKSINIQPVHFFLAMLKVFPVLQKFVSISQLSNEVFREVVAYHNELIDKEKRVNIFNPRYRYYRTGGVFRNVVFGYTFILNKFSRDINKEILNSEDIFGVGHDKEVEGVISTVSKLNKKNALLIGEPGVGKSSIIKGLAQKINHGNIPSQLAGKRIIQLDINGLMAYSNNNQQNTEALMEKSMKELEKAGNVILYVDEIQELIPAKAESSGQSMAAMMLPYILDSKFPIVATINYSDYKRYFYSTESLRNNFENIEVKELSARDAFYILKTKIRQLEQNFGLYVTFPALYSAIELSQRYIQDRKLPDSAVNTIESAAAWAQSKDIEILKAKDISSALSSKIEIPIQDVTADEATKLLNLEDRINEKVIGQDEAIHSVVEALKRARTDIRDPNKPIGVFLFLGPTGTGKTHLAKTISQEYFGNKNDIVRIDMSEYQTPDNINRLIGSQSDAEHASSVTLLDKVKSNPFTVVLFDEIEKADQNILNLFLQLFDEGRLTSGKGELVNFNNTIIICTSNIGSQVLLESLERDDTMWEEAKNRALLELRQSLKPEFLNRFDKTIIFTPHTIEALKQIAILLLNDLALRVQDRGIEIKWEESIPMLIANKANEPGMGARPLRRFIQERIEGKLADEILLLGENINGQVVEIRESWLA